MKKEAKRNHLGKVCFASPKSREKSFPALPQRLFKLGLALRERRKKVELASTIRKKVSSSGGELRFI
jgi:hypothetical protein